MFLFKSRFFHIEIFISSREFFFSCRDLYFKSRIFFFTSRFVFQVEFFLMSRIFSCRDFYFKSRIFFFHVEICISSRGIFRIFSCRDLYFKPSFLSHVENFFMLTFFFSRGECVFIASRDFCSLRGLSSGHFAIQGEMLPRSTCRHLLAMIKVIR